MRRALLPAVLLAAFASATASAAPKLTLTVKSIPIRGFHHTGNILNAGASLLVHVGIEGTEYAGGPPPLSSLGLTLPAGSRWSTNGFPTCESNSLLLFPPPSVCPENQLGYRPVAGSEARAQFGTELLREAATLQTSYEPRGVVALLLEGHQPVHIEARIPGTVAFQGPGARPRFEFAWPLIETVPGGTLTDFSALAFKLGSGRRVPGTGRVGFSLHMPRRCPGHLQFVVQADFAAVAGLPVRTARAFYRAPCPRHF